MTSTLCFPTVGEKKNVHCIRSDLKRIKRRIDKMLILTLQQINKMTSDSTAKKEILSFVLCICQTFLAQKKNHFFGQLVAM